jgi:phosphoglycolate phosphatase
MPVMKKTALITDLDNTLFDWVELWLNSFSSMLDSIVEISGIPKEQLIPEIRDVHRKHGTSEYSFLIDELPSLKLSSNSKRAVDVFAPAINAYREKREQFLHLYPSVAETLLKIKGRGTRIIGYTESMAFYSNYRLKHLGLDGVLDCVFCPVDHQIPVGLSDEDLRMYPSAESKLKYTSQKFTPKGSKKPDTVVLDSIIQSLGLAKTECIYVGDNLSKDVAMAVDCGVDSVWAKYGQAHKRAEYKLLQDVTHWTQEEVKREQEIREREHVHPKYTLENSFAELLNVFQFEEFSA